MRYDYNRQMKNTDLAKKMFEEYLPTFFSSDSLKTKEDYILFLTVLCGFISKEEIVTFTGMSYTYCEKIIKSLLRKGFIKTIPLSSSKSGYVSRTNTLYTFTKEGYKHAANLDEGKKILNPYRQKKANDKNIHDYLNGMNLLACLVGLCGTDFSWTRECLYGGYRKSKKTLVADSEIALPDFTLHIEEDIGNEKNNIILDKLLLYQKYPDRDHAILSSDKDALLISYYKPSFLERAAYHQRSINALAEMVKKNSPSALLEDAFSGIPLPPEQTEALKSLFQESPTRKDGKSTLRVSDLLEMSGRFSAENPFYQNACKKDQYERFRVKKKNLFGNLCKEPKYQTVRDDIFKGHPVYIAPTLLLERYVRHICRFESYHENIRHCLESYFGRLSEYTPRAHLGNNVFLRNHFLCKGGDVYLEYPTIDLGALLRINLFLDQSRNLPGGHHLILVVDSVPEAFEIAKWIGDFDRATDQSLVPGQDTLTYLFLNKDRNDIYYLRRFDLESGRAERLFSVTGYKEYADNNGNMVGVGEFKIFYLISENNPILKEEG